jgi:hypothetical protein
LSNGVIFIQWTQAGGQVTGSAQAVYLDGATTTAAHETIDGSIEGSNLTLSVQPDGLYGTSNLSGQLQGSGFVLSIPANSGSLVPVTFTPATAADYDSDVAALGERATQTSNAQAQAQARQQAAASLAQQQTAAQNDAATVASDISGLSGDVSSVSSDLATMKNDLGTEAKDLTTAETDAATAAALVKQYPAGDSGQVCSDASQAGSDATQVGSDAVQINSDGIQIESDVRTQRNDASSLQSDWQSYLAALPSGYAVANAPSAADVTGAIKSASSDSASLIAQANQLIGTANGDVVTALNAANAPMAAGNCGSLSGPTPDTTIPS